MVSAALLTYSQDSDRYDQISKPSGSISQLEDFSSLCLRAPGPGRILTGWYITLRPSSASPLILWHSATPLLNCCIPTLRYSNRTIGRRSMGFFDFIKKGITIVKDLVVSGFIILGSLTVVFYLISIPLPKHPRRLFLCLHAR